MLLGDIPSSAKVMATEENNNPEYKEEIVFSLDDIANLYGQFAMKN